MNLTPELAEVLGIFAADGSMQDNHICMWGNISEDKEYYDKIVCPLFSKVFNKKVVAHEKRSNSVYGFYICNKKAVEFLKNFGFSKRKTYSVEVPKIILENSDNKILSAFIRGFSDCDGGFSLMKRKGKYSNFKLRYNTYPRISIISVSGNIIEGLSNMLKKLEVKHTLYIEKSKRSTDKDSHRITIRGTERIEDWMKKIGFNNPAQTSRYLVWKKFGFCPPKSTIEQRQLILSDKLNPCSLY